MPADASEANTRSLGAPDRAIAVIDCCWGAGERLASGDDGCGGKQADNHDVNLRSIPPGGEIELVDQIDRRPPDDAAVVADVGDFAIGANLL